MKNLAKIFLSFLVLTALACEEVHNAPHPLNSTFKVVSYDELRQGTSEIYSKVRTTGDRFIDDSGGLRLLNLENLQVRDGFDHFKVRVFLPTERDKETITSMRTQEFKEYVLEGIDEIGFSSDFKAFIDDAVTFVSDFDAKELGEIEAYFKETLKEVAAANIDEVEKFTLTQLLANSLASVQSAYDVEQVNVANGRVAGCPSNWKSVAEDAFKAGIAVGISTGIRGVRAGAAAGMGAGNPIAGGLIGGAIGFTLGFVGGAAVGGGAKLLWDCITSATQTTATPKMFTCSGQVYYAYTASVPTGCTEGGVDLVTKESFGISLIDILDVNLVPNSGSNNLSPTLTKKLSLVLQ